MTGSTTLTRERADLIESLRRHRGFLRFTVRDLTDEQAAQRTTESELCLGGLIKHVAATEQQWIRFIQDGPKAMSWEGGGMADWMAGFRMLDGETLAGLLDAYDQVAQATDELVASWPDLDAAHPLPEAPWFERGAAFLEREMDAGRLRRYDARQLLLTGYGAVLSYLSDAPLMTGLLDIDPLSPAALAARREHVIDLLRNAVAP